jgi:hypothetical protein
MHILFLKLGNGHLDCLVGVVIVAELLDSCLDIIHEVFLDNIVYNIRKGLILMEDGGLI